MARITEDTIQNAWQYCYKIKIFNIGDLASILKCSIPNTRLKLKQWQVYTSFNQNGRFYTLPPVPTFDKYGLWRYKEAAFSKHGNLKKTIVHLVSSAPAGLTGKQLGEILGLSPQSFLHHFRNCSGICREKHDGVFVYFAEDLSVYGKQIHQRASIISLPHRISLTEPEVIMILAAIIKHHGIGIDDILALPELKKSRLSKTAIQNFMESHDLLKKTPDTKH